MSAYRDLKNSQQRLNECVAALVKRMDIICPPGSPREVIGDQAARSAVGELRAAYATFDRLRLDVGDRGAANNRQTSILAGVTTLPNKKSLRYNILAALVGHQARNGVGMNISALKGRLRKEHSSVSSAVNALLVRELVRDSGTTAKTQYNKDAIVWVATERAIELFRLQTETPA